MLIWVLLCLHVSNVYPRHGTPSIERIVMLVVAVGFCILIRRYGGTHVGDHQHVAYVRTTEVLNAMSLREARDQQKRVATSPLREVPR